MLENGRFFIFLLMVISITTFRLESYMSEPELLYHFSTNNQNNIPDFDLVYLPQIEATESETDYSFSAFSSLFNLRLKRNNALISDAFKTFVHENDRVDQFVEKPQSCHFIHQGDERVAAISACDHNTMHGLLVMGNTTYEITPLSPRLRLLVQSEETLLSADNISRKPHIIKRAIIPGLEMHNESNRHNSTVAIAKHEFLKSLKKYIKRSSRPVGKMTIELALFFDEAAYKTFAPFFNHSITRIREMILAYLNAVQALYHHPSLGNSIELVLVRLDIMKRQPVAMPHYNGERSKLLDSFCAYQQGLNVEDDNNPDHWDMGLYVSGLDFYAYENGRKSGVTMGLATVGGVCLLKYACVIAELGTTNVFGKPYPSAGFTSVYILAHEIGHNLGMHHDGVGNSCSKEGYIMSPSRGTNGETQWSSCSAQIISQLSWAKCLFDSSKAPKELDHSIFVDLPGQKFTAKRQCEFLLRDQDAVPAPGQHISTICYNLQCKTPNRSGYYFSGPALEGTHCGSEKYCIGGECIVKQVKPEKEIKGGWGAWKTEKCTSGCIQFGRGYSTKRRKCNNPIPVNSDSGCEGSSLQIELCKDTFLCNKKVTVEEYASKKCKEFSHLLPELDMNSRGLQAPHEAARVWMGCAIFCKNAKSNSFYTPRLELNDLGISPYFPDGTWCHREGLMNYYCLHHHCLPENFQFSKTVSILHEIGEDIPFSQMAQPGNLIFDEIKEYLSLGPDGKPLKTLFSKNDLKKIKEKDWDDDDYVEMLNSREINI